MLPETASAEVVHGGQRYAWHRWADLLVPRPGTETLATYADHYYQGRAAATRRALGRGSVTMIGVSTDDGVLERQLVHDAYARAGVPVMALPVGVFLEWRAGYYFLFNYRPEPVSPTLPDGAKIVSGQTPLAPAGTLIYT
jgi:beta-galactosidase